MSSHHIIGDEEWRAYRSIGKQQQRGLMVSQWPVHLEVYRQKRAETIRLESLNFLLESIRAAIIKFNFRFRYHPKHWNIENSDRLFGVTLHSRERERERLARTRRERRAANKHISRGPGMSRAESENPSARGLPPAPAGKRRTHEQTECYCRRCEAMSRLAQHRHRHDFNRK